MPGSPPPGGDRVQGVWFFVLLVVRTGSLSSAHFQELQDFPPRLASTLLGPSHHFTAPQGSSFKAQTTDRLTASSNSR